MTKEQQDFLWRSLPEEERESFRMQYSCGERNLYNSGYEAALTNVFGAHNLTASEEEKSKFKSGYKIGDKVVVTGSLCESKGQTITLVKHYDVPREANDYNKLWVGLLADGGTRSFAEKDFTPLVELEDVSSCGESNPSLSNPSNIGKDWLAYRMELAKVVATALIGKGHNIAFVPESTTLIVDGIVERLKGGEK